MPASFQPHRLWPRLRSPRSGLRRLATTFRQGYCRKEGSRPALMVAVLTVVGVWGLQPVARAGDEPVVEVRRALPVGGDPLIEAALDAGDAKELDRLFSLGVPVDVPMSDGDTPLLSAMRRGSADLASICLDWCAAVNAVGVDGATPLVMAIVSGQSGLARQLVEAGADANAPLPAPAPAAVVDTFRDPWFVTQLKSDAGITPLMLASVQGDEGLVSLLLEYGGRPYQRTRRYTTDALTLACRAGQLRCAQRLLRRDPDAPDGQRVIVTLGDQRATLLRGEEVVLTSRVSTGKKGYATPTGEFLITSKHRDWTSTIYKAPMPYLLRLNASAIGLHQGVVPGYPASHGCIRLPANQAAAFFKTARIGDRVLIRH